MEDEKQAVVEDTESEAKPSPEDQASDVQGEVEDRDYVAEALKEWEVPQKAPVEPETYAPEVPDVNTELYQTVQELQRERVMADINKATKAVRGDLDSEIFDDGLVQSYLDAQVRSNPKLQSVWDNRSKNPEQFNKALNALQKNFQKKYGKLAGLDPKATEDRELVAHAVKGGSKPAPADSLPNLGGMPDGEYRSYIKKKFGFDPGV